jgi:Icc-related predicted phosphoesterase
MNDFRLIRNPDYSAFQPENAISLHQGFKEKLINWFQQDLAGPRVVISHLAPVINPNTQYRNSPLMPGFNSLDMKLLIETHQPHLWIYGHTHECDRQHVGKTLIVSNQRGYPRKSGGFECAGFDENGLEIEV